MDKELQDKLNAEKKCFDIEISGISRNLINIQKNINKWYELIFSLLDEIETLKDTSNPESLNLLKDIKQKINELNQENNLIEKLKHNRVQWYLLTEEEKNVFRKVGIHKCLELDEDKNRQLINFPNYFLPKKIYVIREDYGRPHYEREY